MYLDSNLAPGDRWGLALAGLVVFPAWIWVAVPDEKRLGRRKPSSHSVLRAHNLVSQGARNHHCSRKRRRRPIGNWPALVCCAHTCCGCSSYCTAGQGRSRRTAEAASERGELSVVVGGVRAIAQGCEARGLRDGCGVRSCDPLILAFGSPSDRALAASSGLPCSALGAAAHAALWLQHMEMDALALPALWMFISRILAKMVAAKTLCLLRPASMVRKSRRCTTRVSPGCASVRFTLLRRARP